MLVRGHASKKKPDTVTNKPTEARAESCLLMDGQGRQKGFYGQEVGETRQTRKAIELGLRAVTGYRQLPTIQFGSHFPTSANHYSWPFLLY